MRLLERLGPHRTPLLAVALVCCIRALLLFTGTWIPNDGGDLPESQIFGTFGFDLLNGTRRGWETYFYQPIAGHFASTFTSGLFAIVPFNLNDALFA